mmetsp:Transcript_23917/g.50740  ORF Transcript_23917/g.50740 Transcript_23917/m.50740 type:complete len:90 (+) Transcript_23917:43-312(+)
MKLTMILSNLLSHSFAWDKEYAGFVHLHNWNGHVNDIQENVRLPDGTQLPAELSKIIALLILHAIALGELRRMDAFSGQWFSTQALIST